MSETDEGVMTVQETCAYLRLAQSTVYKLAQAGKLPGRKIGGTWRFSRPVLTKWLENTQAGTEEYNNLVDAISAFEIGK